LRDELQRVARDVPSRFEAIEHLARDYARGRSRGRGQRARERLARPRRLPASTSSREWLAVASTISATRRRICRRYVAHERRARGRAMPVLVISA
jgi:hypothetical protein